MQRIGNDLISFAIQPFDSVEPLSVAENDPLNGITAEANMVGTRPAAPVTAAVSNSSRMIRIKLAALMCLRPNCCDVIR